MALVTGAAQSIGLAIAERFAREGAAVTIADIAIERAAAAASRRCLASLDSRLSLG